MAGDGVLDGNQRWAHFANRRDFQALCASYLSLSERSRCRQGQEYVWLVNEKRLRDVLVFEVWSRIVRVNEVRRQRLLL
jgi:hypothetical protein